MSIRFPVVIVLTALLCGCASRPAAGPYAPMTEERREPSRAEAINRRAAELMDSNPTEAERLLREALSADLFCGPAHNNLGILHLRVGSLYEAAAEFEWARKLLPGHPDPRLNLGLALERAGRDDQAQDAYRAALDVWPEHLASVQALARLRVRRGMFDEETIALLHDVAFRGETAVWRDWARLEAARREP